MILGLIAEGNAAWVRGPAFARLPSTHGYDVTSRRGRQRFASPRPVRPTGDTANGASGSRDIDYTTRGARVRERDAIESIRPLADQRGDSSPQSSPRARRRGRRMRWPSPFGAAGAACFTVYAAFKVVTERLDRARRLQA
jgi:hypothetical protein